MEQSVLVHAGCVVTQGSIYCRAQAAIATVGTLTQHFLTGVIKISSSV